ncbi:MAG: hypothetical protein LAP38_10845 [Acidobacteriia bacterium]|nr:hypothetical protein [Terriglobia bacterium]
MLSAVLTVALIAGSAACLGWLFPRTVDRHLSLSEALALRLLLGLGLLGLALFLVGSVSWTETSVWTVLLAPIGAFSISMLRDSHRERCAATWRKILHPGTPSLWAVLAAAVIAWHLLSGFAAPVGDTGNDAISYHLLGPVVWQRTHVVRPVLDHSHTAFPENVEMLFGAGMLLGNDRVPGLVGTVFAAILLIQVRGLAIFFGAPRRVASLAMAIAATMPVLIDTSESGFVDIPYAAFGLAACRLAFSSTGSSGLALAGVFAGLAAGEKYTGLVNLVLIAVVLLLRPAAHMTYVPRIRSVLLLSATALVLGSPWYLRNAALLGTPIYPPPPVLSNYVHARAFPPDAVQFFQGYIQERGKGYGRGLLQLILLPFNFTYRPGGFHGAGGIGLVPLAFLPMSFGAIRRNTASLAWLIWSALFVVAWFYTQQEARFFIPVLAVTAAWGAIGAASLWARSGRTTRILTGTLVVVSLGYGVLTDVFADRERIASLFSTRAEAARQARIPDRGALQYLNDSAAVRSVLVLNRFFACYYLHKPYVKIRGQYGEQPLPGIADTSAALRQLPSLGVTHILDVQGLFGTRFELDPSQSPYRLVWSSPDARIYEVTGP